MKGYMRIVTIQTHSPKNTKMQPLPPKNNNLKQNHFLFTHYVPPPKKTKSQTEVAMGKQTRNNGKGVLGGL